MHLRRAVDLEPEALRYLHGLADHYLRVGNAPLARDVASRMLELAPDEPLAQQLWSMAEALAARSGD